MGTLLVIGVLVRMHVDGHLLVASLDVVQRSVGVELEDIERVQVEIRRSWTKESIDLFLGRRLEGVQLDIVDLETNQLLNWLKLR